MTLLSRLLNRTQKCGTDANIQLLSRPGCHLCDDALLALRREFAAASIEVVDITKDNDLESEYVFRIPVVLHKGDVIVEGVIGRIEARAARSVVSRRMRFGDASR